jgi:DNA polymerase-3 subunit gamma/tau
VFSKDARPRLFRDIIGQRNNVKIFTKKAESLDFDYPDVMLLEGLSGSGKTTTAKIIASTVNCHNPVKNADGYYDPCLTCPSCLSIVNETYNRDVSFYKGSEMEKEDVLALEELASLSPMYDRKRIIIIDEFQELSKKSKGASLVLLEKERSNVIFMLCTMDVESIDKSVRSRAQVYKFKPLTSDEIGQALIKQLTILDPDEKIPIEPEVLVLIAKNSWGSLRQALNNLEHCLDGELYTIEQAEKELGFISEEKAYVLLQKLLTKDPTFYRDLGDIKTQDFYIYSFAVLSRTEKTLLSKSPDDWLFKNSHILKTASNFEELRRVYFEINMQNGNYFKDYIFDSLIGAYMYNQPPVLNQERRVRTPKS